MANYDFDIGIIGGGAAGLTVASGAAQLGAKTLLIEKEPTLGGDCLHFGCVPSKTLIKSAHVYHMMKHSEAFGLPVITPPPVDFKQVAKRIQSVIDIIQKHDSEERFCSLGARVEFGEARFSDDHSIRIDRRIYSAKTWVIATGSAAAVPPIPGLDKTAYITNREIFSLESLPSSMIVLGAGPIGIEMAQAFNRLGSRVSVVDLADQILINEDPDMAGVVQETLEDEGVTFYLGSAIQRVAQAGQQSKVTIQLTDGNVRDLTAERVLVSLGRRANVTGLGLADIGVEFDAGGIKVDSRLKTSRSHIYAAGDVNGGYQFTHTAGYEGGIVVSNAVFHIPRKASYTFMPWCTYSDPELASIGMNEKRARNAGIPFKVWTESFKDNDRSLAEGEVKGKLKLLLDNKEKPIGIQIVGPRAGELINEWVALINGNVKLSSLAAAVHPYPTIGEINKKVAGSIFSPKIFSDKVKKTLKFIFQLKGRACGEDQPVCADIQE